MVQSAQHLFECIKPCLALFAQLWQVPEATAQALCQDGAKLMADKLAFYRPSYRFGRKLRHILQEPVTLGMLTRLKDYALPCSFFNNDELNHWQQTHPSDKNKQMLGLLGVLLLWLSWHKAPKLCLGQPISLAKSSKFDKLANLYNKQKAWLVVGAFLFLLGFGIWQALPTPITKQTTNKAQANQVFYDIAIVRIDDE